MDVIKILKDMVAVPSVSGNESALAGQIAAVLSGAGAMPKISGRNIWAMKGKPGKVLLVNAHLDTVSPTDSWTRAPFEPAEEDGKIYGLGANDDKGSLSALLAAFLETDEESLGGTLIFCGTCDEEIGGAGLEAVVKEMPRPDAVLIGEPTNLRVCSAQKGQVRMMLRARGEAGHAARPVPGKNAIINAARDIVALDELVFGEKDELLGYPTIVSTIINGGTKGNVVPDLCEVVLDGRSTTVYDNDRLIKIVEETCKSELVVKSKRIRPRVTAADEKIVAAALEAAGCENPTAFGGVSELFCVPDIPGVVLGPGLPKMSHAADEYIEIKQVRDAVEIYKKLFRSFLKG